MNPILLWELVTKYWRYVAAVLGVVALFFAWHHLRDKIFQSGVSFCESAAKDAALGNVEKLEVIKHDTESKSDNEIDADLRSLGIMRRAEDR